MALIAIITARGGSKRIPHKNIREFCGSPILAYSIEAAKESGIFADIMVSTDDTEIAEIARKYGASIPFLRSEQVSGDYATTTDVIRETLEQYHKLGQSFDTFCCLYPTAPFITAEKLRRAWDMMQEKEIDAVVSVVPFSFPPQRGFVVRGNSICYQYPQYAMTRSQDLEPIYHDCGQFYMCRTEAFQLYHTLIPPKTAPFIVSELEAQDIDNLSDWTVAEMKYEAFVKKEACKNVSSI